MAESLLLKHQLLVLNRGRQIAPMLSPWDRLLLALTSLWIEPSRIQKLAAVLKQSALLAFHKSLVRKKYRRLFAATRKARLGSKGLTSACAETGRVVQRKAATPGYGVALGGRADKGRLQVRAIALTSNHDKLRDRDIETNLVR